MLDAYTVRKAIPRIVVAVIAINLSIYLCVAALDITTVVGKGIGQILVSAFVEPGDFKGIKVEPNTENSILGVLGVGGIGAIIAAIIASGGAIAVSLLGLLLPLVITIALTALAILFTLVIWQALVIFLTVISPVAIACYILPGTEKYFKQWWDLYFRTLLVYPIIAVLFAMGNVMGAILLGASTSSPDGVGTIQLVAAVLVIFAPLVLIPFAFKLAGGAIASVMNLAQGRASTLAGRAGQSIQKSRQDPNSWLGSRAFRARENRRTAGFTPGQIMSGLSSGTKATLRGRSFRSAYSAASGTLGRESAFDQASAFMENNAAFKAISGNDDTLWAFRHGKNEAEVRKYLGEKGLEGRDLDESVAMVMRARAQTSKEVGDIAAVRAQAKTGTGYADNADMYEDIITAAGGDMNLGARMYAEMRGSAVNSGRMELGTASFMAGVEGMSGIRDAIASGDNAAVMSAKEAANKKTLRSVIDSNSSAAAVHGKPKSAEAIAEAHREKIDDFMHSLSTGAVIDVNGQQRVATARDVKQALAAAHGVHDAMQSASPQNARAFADKLMGGGINVAGLSSEARASLGPAFEAPAIGGQSSLGPSGNLTYKMVMDDLAGRDQTYAELRRDFANASLAQQAERDYEIRSQMNPPAAGQNPGGPPPPPGGTP